MNDTFNTFDFDEYVVCAQGFQDSDYDPRFKYICNTPDRLGWVKARNELLRYFYNSDSDYAFWIDANSNITKPTKNDAYTLLSALKDNKLDFVDAIFSTLGIWVSQERIELKKQNNYFDVVTLVPSRQTRNYNWMHGLIIKNFKKYYNEEIYIDDKCDTLQGLPEDVYFARLLKQLKVCYIAPTIVISKPDSRGSTQWAREDGKYNYPPVKFDCVDQMIFTNILKNQFQKNDRIKDIIEIPRLDRYKNYMKSFVSKSKVVNNDIYQKIDLF